MSGKYVLTYSKPSHWFSCRLITNELLNNYKGYKNWDIAEAIPSDLSELVIPDHRWLSPHLAKKLPASCQLTLYLFGDFTLKLGDFAELFPELLSRELILVVASHAQKRLVGSLFPEALPLIRVTHYPFQLSQVTSPEEIRTGLGIASGQKIIGYVGRMSRQKGVLSLMESFLQVQSTLGAKLMLCGPLDFHPLWQFNDSPDTAGKKRFEKLLKLGAGQIIWIPFLSREKLSALYQCLDLFVSPSTFHDEDFGLSVAEAISLKTPALISAWGGYLEYAGQTGVTLLNPSLGNTGYEITVETLAGALRGEMSPATKHQFLTLSHAERSYIIRTPRFLNRGDVFDLELYKKIYASYLLC